MANQAVNPPKPAPFTLPVTLLVIILMVLLCLLAQRGENPGFVQVLVGVTLVIGFGYGWIDRVRGMRPRLREDEALLGRASARLLDGMIPVDGLLTVTSHRLVFSPLWPGPVVELKRDRAIRAQHLDCARLWISSHSAEYVFEIQNAREWLHLLASNR